MSNGWIAFDFDGTLATYGSKQWPLLGDPIAAMVALAKNYLADGREVKILTARVSSQYFDEKKEQEALIKAWCKLHIGQELEVTCRKDYSMEILYDDRAITVEKNTGRILTDTTLMAIK